MRCDEVKESLSAFKDDELDPVRSREIERHLIDCPDCAESLGEMKALGERMRAEAPYYRATDTLRERVTRAAWKDASASQWSRRRLVMLSWVGAAAAALVVGVGTWIFASGAAVVPITEREVVSSHIRSLMASHLTDVASTDQHTVKPWFAGKLDFSPPVSDLSASGYPLIGGRLDYVGGRPVAALVYQRRKHWINVFTWPVERAGDSKSPPHTRQGYHVIHETHAGTTFWIVSDVNSKELSEFAGLLVASADQGR